MNCEENFLRGAGMAHIWCELGNSYRCVSASECKFSNLECIIPSFVAFHQCRNDTLLKDDG